MDFYKIVTREIEKGPRKGEFELYPDFVVGRSEDLMIRGRSFYAIWDEEKGLWSTDEYDVQRLVDAELRAEAQSKKELGISYHVKYLQSFNTNTWSQFRKFMQNISDNSHTLDDHLTFANSEVKKSDYVSRRLPYALEAGDHSSWDELVGTLYDVEERAKIEWAIGAVVSGDAKSIQKFLVLYGPAGTGKSTVLNIVQKLFQGFYTTFEAKALTGNNNAFATEAFKSNPLVAIQHDGDLSKIEDNTKLNSLVSHEEMTMNEKYKPSYTSKIGAFLFMGTNQPVKITDAKSGIIRRLIDVKPTGVKIPTNHYNTLMSKIDFELGAIAQHCFDVYLQMGKNFYNGYRPTEMMLLTDRFFNFIEANYDIFKAQDGISLKQAYAMYKEWCSETGIEYTMAQYKMREELRNYFDDFKDRATIDGQIVRSWYSGFNAHKFKAPNDSDETSFSLVMDETESLFDTEYAKQPAQLEVYDEEAQIFRPQFKWKNVKTKLGQLDTSQVHFVKVPPNHIIIDFDLKDQSNEKSLERNLEAASVWPATYAELSKSGAGVHLHYDYDGDVSLLSEQYSEGIEVKVYDGDASLRRKLSKCNNVPVATINSGLPIKEKKVLTSNTIQSEKGLRDLISRNLRKEIHPGTKPSIDFIKKILDDAFESGMTYDLMDMRPKIIAFATGSTNQAFNALKVVQQMKFQGETTEISNAAIEAFVKDAPLVFFDVEVYPNLFVVCWKYQGATEVVRMINPSPQDIEGILKFKLVGYNNRRYDNHILYARFMGYDNEALYNLSQKIIANNRGAMFGEAYNISYADIYDFSSKKQTLKKFMIELGIEHMEMDLPWDEPVDEKDIPRIVEYCVNDVEGTEVVFEDRKQDFVARQILADLSGLSVNDTTQRHTAKIVFGDEKNPQKEFNYTDLSKEFEGYVFNLGKSTYRGESPGEGGYVYDEPGLYEDVALLDVTSMHPTTIQLLDLFGPFTKNFAALVAARVAIKRRDYDEARTLLDGKLARFLEDPKEAEALSYALKIVINIVYGLTSAKFENMFKDPRNYDNIVAKRGALFMIDLKHAVQEKGFTVAHIKTDSIKIPNATQEIIDFVITFGAKYGYNFEHEATYEKFALVNAAVFIAKKDGKWLPTGAQFQHPYVFKTLFGDGNVTFEDLCETKQVTQGAMYLDFEAENKPAALAGDMQFIGRIGRFVPVKPGLGGGILYRRKDGVNYAVTGTKGHFWMEADKAMHLRRDEIDMSYFERLEDEALKTIEKFGSYEELTS